ncbi:hypothetical protein H0H93_006258, partial [Arthromyces matolae]
MENLNINEYLKNNPDATRLLLALDVAQGVEYLHTDGIVHGSLRGVGTTSIACAITNILYQFGILVDENGRARISNVGGVSSTLDANLLTLDSHYTGVNNNVRWLAPELMDLDGKGNLAPTQKSDIYAMACVFYENLFTYFDQKIYAGVVPFADLRRDVRIVTQVSKGARPQRPEPSSPSWIAWGLNEPIWTLITTCWAQQPSSRPTSNKVARRLAALVTIDPRPPSQQNLRRRLNKNSIDLEALNTILAQVMGSDLQIPQDSNVEAPSRGQGHPGHQPETIRQNTENDR